MGTEYRALKSFKVEKNKAGLRKRFAAGELFFKNKTFSRVVFSLLDGARPSGGAERRDDLLPSRTRLERRLTARPAAGPHPGGRADRRPAQGQGFGAHLQESECAL